MSQRGGGIRAKNKVTSATTEFDGDVDVMIATLMSLELNIEELAKSPGLREATAVSLGLDARVVTAAVRKVRVEQIAASKRLELAPMSKSGPTTAPIKPLKPELKGGADKATSQTPLVLSVMAQAAASAGLEVSAFTPAGEPARVAAPTSASSSADRTAQTPSAAAQTNGAGAGVSSASNATPLQAIPDRLPDQVTQDRLTDINKQMGFKQQAVMNVRRTLAPLQANVTRLEAEKTRLVSREESQKTVIATLIYDVERAEKRVHSIDAETPKNEAEAIRLNYENAKAQLKSAEAILKVFLRDCKGNEEDMARLRAEIQALRTYEKEYDVEYKDLKESHDRLLQESTKPKNSDASAAAVAGVAAVTPVAAVASVPTSVTASAAPSPGSGPDAASSSAHALLNGVDWSMSVDDVLADLMAFDPSVKSTRAKP